MMRLHSIEVKNWRKHAEKKIELGEKTTVIYGPNETGKSTILEALSRGFFDRSSSEAKEIRRIKPLTARGSVSSIIKIQFSLKDGEYLVEKTFNHNSGTLLYEIKDSKRNLLAQDDSADKILIDKLEADLQTSGASKPSKWGAFYWLWTPQDKRELPSEGNTTSSLHLDQSKGTVLVTPKFHSVQEGINSLYSQYFTKTGGNRRKSPLMETEEELNSLKIERGRLTLRIRDVDDNKRELEKKLRELPKHEEIVNKSKSELEIAKRDASDFAKIEVELEASSAIIREIQRNIDEALQAIQELQESSNQIQDLQKEENNIRDNLSRIEAICNQLESQLKEINKEIEDKSNELRNCDELTADANILYKKYNVLHQINDLEEKIERIKKLDEKLEELRSKEKPLLITQKDLEELDRNQIQIKILKERLTESGLYVTINPGEKDNLSVEVDGNKIKDQKTATGTQNVKVFYEDLGEVNVSANLQKALDIKVDIERLQSRINDALQKTSVSSIEILKELYAEQTDISNEIRNFLFERKGVDEKSLKEIEAELETKKEKYLNYEAIERSELAIKSNPTDIDLGELVRQRESEREKSSNELNSLREKRENISSNFHDNRSEMIELRIRCEQISEQLIKSLKHQQDLIRKYGSEENQKKILEEEREKLGAKKGEHKAIEERYKKIEEGPLARIKSLENKIENQENIIQQHRASVEQLKGQIIQGSLDGSYSQLSDVESRIEALEDRFQREEIRANSFKLLKDVLEAQYHQALRSVTEPIKHDVEEYLSYVTGNLHEEVKLDKNLLPICLGERGTEELSLEFEDGSSGLKEILALCIRLAVAKHLSEIDSQCLVLDDPFVHVSSDRSEKMIELINKVVDEEGLQVVVLTHRQMEFASFAGEMIDIRNP